ncbi:hypothetical protein BD414DRAFT_208119 [Trametes punicea]|nr:hypothetical protein BD414DRAFT_208119 [Trametes punicea]
MLRADTGAHLPTVDRTASARASRLWPPVRPLPILPRPLSPVALPDAKSHVTALACLALSTFFPLPTNPLHANVLLTRRMSSTIPSAYPSSSAAGMSGAGCSSGAVPAPFAQTTKMNLGAILIGCVIQNLFYGNCFFLAWRYFAKDRRGDPWWFLGAVALAWILSSLSVAITVHGLWFFVMESMFHKTARTPWTVDFFLFMNSAVATVVRLLYVCRLWKLCQSLTHLRGRALSAGVLLLTILLCCVELAGSIEISVRLLHSNGSERGDVGNTLKPIFYLIFATGLSADAILTVMMCLWLHSARTGFKRTDSIINTMIVYTIETGLFPSLVETGGMIAFIVNSNSQIFLAFYLQIGVLYLTSLLTS